MTACDPPFRLRPQSHVWPVTAGLVASGLLKIRLRLAQPAEGPGHRRRFAKQAQPPQRTTHPEPLGSVRRGLRAPLTTRNVVQASVAPTFARCEVENRIFYVAVNGHTTFIERLLDVLASHRVRADARTYSDFRPDGLRHSHADIVVALLLHGRTPMHRLEDGLSVVAPRNVVRCERGVA